MYTYIYIRVCLYVGLRYEDVVDDVNDDDDELVSIETLLTFQSSTEIQFISLSSIKLRTHFDRVCHHHYLCVYSDLHWFAHTNIHTHTYV